MPLPVIDGALRISVTGLTAGGGRWSNTWHAVRPAGGGWDLADILTFDANFRPFYLGPNAVGGASVSFYVVPQTTFEKADYTPLDGSSGAYTVPWNGIGEAAGQPAPAEVAEVMTLRTALRGRQNRGRIYLPAFENGYFDGVGHIDAGVAAALMIQAQGMMNEIAIVPCQLAVGSYGPYVDPALVAAWLAGGKVGPRPAATITAGAHVTPITSITMDLVADVQRHRKS